MSIEELDLLNSRIHSSQMHVEEESSQNHSTGIALPNINKRIRLLLEINMDLMFIARVDVVQMSK